MNKIPKTKNKIIEKEIIPKFLEICPEFRKRWEEHLKYWGKDKRGIYIDTAEFVHFIDDSYGGGDTKKFLKIFEQIEFYLTRGDNKIKDIIALGILETLQNVASHRKYSYTVFEKWLGPVSKNYWKEIEIMWVGKSNLADVIRSERKSKNY